MLSKIEKVVSKLKKGNVYTIVAVVLAVILSICLLINQKGSNVTKNDNLSSAISEYNLQLENKLISVISSLDGVGDVTVAITFSDFGEKLYAYETKTQESVSGSVTTSSIVTVGGEPLVTMEKLPTIFGVVVVAKGAKDPLVKVKVVQAVVTLLGVDSNLVEVFC